MIDPKERKKWIDSYVKETELQYYKSTPKKQVITYIHDGYNKIELIITQKDFTFSLHTISITPLIITNDNQYFSHTIELFKKYNIFNKKDTTMQNLNNILLNARTEGDNPCVSEKVC